MRRSCRSTPTTIRASCSATCSAPTADRSQAASTASARSASPARTSAPAAAWRPPTWSAPRSSTCSTRSSRSPSASTPTEPQLAAQPIVERLVGATVAARELGAQLSQQPRALGDHVVRVDRLEVALVGLHEGVVLELGELLDDARDHLAHDVLHEARIGVRLLDDMQLVGALQQGQD